MDFITVKSIGGSTWSFRKERIEMVTERFRFKENEIDRIPELRGRISCAIIKLIGNNQEYYCNDSYKTIMELLKD